MWVKIYREWFTLLKKSITENQNRNLVFFTYKHFPRLVSGMLAFLHRTLPTPLLFQDTAIWKFWNTSACTSRESWLTGWLCHHFLVFCSRAAFLGLTHTVTDSLLLHSVLCCVASVLSHSLWPYELEPASLLCPRDSPGKNTEVGCCALFQGIFPT